MPSGTTRREDYVLDANDNRIRVECRALPTDATAASSDSYTRTAGTNRLASMATPAGTRSFTYDARGNLSAEARPARVTVAAKPQAFSLAHCQMPAGGGCLKCCAQRG